MIWIVLNRSRQVKLGQIYDSIAFLMMDRFDLLSPWFRVLPWRIRWCFLYIIWLLLNNDQIKQIWEEVSHWWERTDVIGEGADATQRRGDSKSHGLLSPLQFRIGQLYNIYIVGWLYRKSGHWRLDWYEFVKVTKKMMVVGLIVLFGWGWSSYSYLWQPNSQLDQSTCTDI
jgi:hypothetical protein